MSAGRSFKDGLIIGVTQAVVLIALLLLLTVILGDTQAESLKVQKAIGCELGVPSLDGVRNPTLLRECWTDEGLTPPSYFDVP